MTYVKESLNGVTSILRSGSYVFSYNFSLVTNEDHKAWIFALVMEPKAFAVATKRSGSLYFGSRDLMRQLSNITLTMGSSMGNAVITSRAASCVAMTLDLLELL